MDKEQIVQRISEYLARLGISFNFCEEVKNKYERTVITIPEDSGTLMAGIYVNDEHRIFSKVIIGDEITSFGSRYDLDEYNMTQYKNSKIWQIW